jgi:hypothetical protein
MYDICGNRSNTSTNYKHVISGMIVRRFTYANQQTTGLGGSTILSHPIFIMLFPQLSVLFIDVV